ncbi:hypothetical protein BRD14_06445 [Halobacteriales archaeon SW_5_68_122]|nr:MAG: hypothetical protein BRD14_06445 [Halobacteriales archaeon SW_5_68_122]
MSSIGDAVTYPMESDDWLKTVLIGGAMLLFSFLLIPAFVAYGYMIRAMQASLEGEPEPPSFGDWGGLIVDGLKVFIIGVVYFLVPLAAMVLTVGGAALAVFTGSEAGAAAGAGTLLFGMLATFVLALVFGYFAAVGLVNFAREERFGAAFDVGVVKSVGLDGDFAVPWLVSVGVFLAVSIVTSVLNIIPGLGFVVGVFLNFYALVVAANLWAGGFREATEGGSTAGQTGIEETPA